MGIQIVQHRYRGRPHPPATASESFHGASLFATRQRGSHRKMLRVPILVILTPRLSRLHWDAVSQTTGRWVVLSIKSSVLHRRQFTPYLGDAPLLLPVEDEPQPHRLTGLHQLHHFGQKMQTWLGRWAARQGDQKLPVSPGPGPATPSKPSSAYRRLARYTVPLEIGPPPVVRSIRIYFQRVRNARRTFAAANQLAQSLAFLRRQLYPAMFTIPPRLFCSRVALGSLSLKLVEPVENVSHVRVGGAASS